MFKLLKQDNNNFYVISAGSGAFDLLPLGAAVKRLEFLGVRLEEIRYALEDLRKTGNDLADFGINGTFLYSTKATSSKTLHH